VRTGEKISKTPLSRVAWRGLQLHWDAGQQVLLIYRHLNHQEGWVVSLQENGNDEN
jgi:hypothetical protein